MKKILLILCAILMVLLLPAAAMAAYSWDSTVSTEGALYALEVTKYAAGRDDTGGVNYFTKEAVDIKTQQFVYFTVGLTLPKHEDLITKYGYDPATDSAKVTIDTEGISAMSTVNSSGYIVQAPANRTTALPAAEAASKTIYYGPDGKWHSVARDAMWAAIVTDASKAAVTASISYDAGVKNVPVEYGTKTYYINAWNGGGFVVSDGTASLRFVTNSTGRVTGALVVMNGSEHKLYATLAGFSVENDTYGLYASVATEFMNVLGISYNAINAGSVFMTGKNILANFKPGICVSNTAKWYAETVTIPATIQTAEVVEVPATGDRSIGTGVIMIALAGAIGAALLVARKRLV